MIVWLINNVARLAIVLILLRVVVSWLDIERTSEFQRAMAALTDPILNPIRSRVHPRGLRIDLSPVIAVIGIEFIRAVLVWILGSWGRV